jgi:hypothetical protein
MVRLENLVNRVMSSVSRNSEGGDVKKIHRIGDLEISQDLAFQRKTWKAERIAWGCIGLIAMSALAGLFGNGPLSRATVGRTEKGFWIEYDRFVRYESPTMLRIHAQGSGGSEIRLRLSRPVTGHIGTAHDQVVRLRQFTFP